MHTSTHIVAMQTTVHVRIELYKRHVGDGDVVDVLLGFAFHDVHTLVGHNKLKLTLLVLELVDSAYAGGLDDELAIKMCLESTSPLFDNSIQCKYIRPG